MVLGPSSPCQAHSEDAIIEVSVVGLCGPLGKISARGAWCAREVKHAIERSLGVPEREQRLFSGMVEVSNGSLAAVLECGSGFELTLIRRSQEQVEWLQKVQQYWPSLRSAPPEILSDREVAVTAVKRSGEALALLSTELRADPDVVLSAVCRNGASLLHANARLRADPDLVLAAVGQHGPALAHAADRLRSAHDFVLAAVERNVECLAFADEETFAPRPRAEVRNEPSHPRSMVRRRALCAHRDFVSAVERARENVPTSEFLDTSSDTGEEWFTMPRNVPLP